MASLVPLVCQAAPLAGGKTGRRLQEVSEINAEQCIWLDPFGVSGLIVEMPEGGEWVSDYELLQQKWEPGWDMRALNYCVDGESGRFLSLQVVLGHEDVEGDEEFRL